MKMKLSILILSILACAGCQSMTKQPKVVYSNLKDWETVVFHKLGIVFEAPIDSYDRKQYILHDSNWVPCMIGGFSLHEFSSDFLMERKSGINIRFYVFTKEEWENYLRSERPLSHQNRHDGFKNHFTPIYTKWRKDSRARDGRVLSACSSGPDSRYKRSEIEAAEDEIAIRRIIESARFINP